MAKLIYEVGQHKENLEEFRIVVKLRKRGEETILGDEAVTIRPTVLPLILTNPNHLVDKLKSILKIVKITKNGVMRVKTTGDVINKLLIETYCKKDDDAYALASALTASISSYFAVMIHKKAYLFDLKPSIIKRIKENGENIPEQIKEMAETSGKRIVKMLALRNIYNAEQSAECNPDGICRLSAEFKRLKEGIILYDNGYRAVLVDITDELEVLNSLLLEKGEKEPITAVIEEGTLELLSKAVEEAIDERLRGYTSS